LKVNKSKSQLKERCRPITKEDLENAFSDYESAETTANGTYRCRDCGVVFETLEEHELHHRKIHSQTGTIPLAGMPM
jgi:uncharacterized C2H2 Zn-finger protein